MAEYSLPDGRILNVPDSATQDDLINLQSQLAELYPDYYAPYKEEIEQTIGGHAREVLRGAPAGLVTSSIEGARGIAAYFDQGNDSDIVKGFLDIYFLWKIRCISFMFSFFIIFD